MSKNGIVYLIHFDMPFKHASHYLGYVQRDLDGRVERHRSGNGAKLLAAVTKAGISFAVVRVWPGDRSLERQLKNRKNSPRLCPIYGKIGATGSRNRGHARPPETAGTGPEAG